MGIVVRRPLPNNLAGFVTPDATLPLVLLSLAFSSRSQSPRRRASTTPAANPDLIYGILEASTQRNRPSRMYPGVRALSLLSYFSSLPSTLAP